MLLLLLCFKYSLNSVIEKMPKYSQISYKSYTYCNMNDPLVKVTNNTVFTIGVICGIPCPIGFTHNRNKSNARCNLFRQLQFQFISHATGHKDLIIIHIFEEFNKSK